MTEFWHAATIWTLRSLVAGGVTLLLVWLALRRIQDPARCHRVIGWSVRAAMVACVLAMLPAWLLVPVPGWMATHEQPIPTVHESAPVEVAEMETPLPEEFVWVPVEIDIEMPDNTPAIVEAEPTRAVTVAAPRVEETHTGTVAGPPDLLAEVAPIVLIAYWLCVGFALLRQLVGYVGLARLRRSASPASDDVQRLATQLANGMRTPCVLVSERLTTPVCFGVFRPTILLPKSLVKTASLDQLRWVLAHELDHLRRGDPRTGVWVGFARAVYFALPWFWAVRRELNLAQEYLADAAAAGTREADYAAFLVELSSRPGVSRSVRAVPSLAGVRAGQSDLYRRVTMLLQPKVEQSSRWSRAWSAVALSSAVSATIVLSGIRLTADEPKKVTEERRIEVRVADGEKRKDGDKPKEGDKPREGDRPRDGEKRKEGDKPRDIERRVEVVIVGNDKATTEIEKAIEDAAAKGDVESVRKLLAKLKAAHGDPKGARIMPPAVPAPPDAIKVRIAHDDEWINLQRALEKLTKAAEEVKDQPEAKAALDKSIAEYQKKLDEAKAKGAVKLAEASKGDAVRKWAQIAQPNAAMLDQIKANMDEMMKAYEKQLGALKGDAKSTEAVKDAMKSYQANMDKLMKQLAGAKEQGQFQWQVQPVVKDQVAKGKQDKFYPAQAAAAPGRFGITIESVPAILIEQLDLPKGQGAILVTVAEGSPAAKAGLKANDVLLEVQGKAVTADGLPKVITGLKGDEAFDVVIVRKGKKETVKGITLPTVKTEGKKTSSSSSKSISIQNDQFEIKAEEDGLKFELKGTVGENDTVAIEIEKDKKKLYEVKGLKNVPAEYREKVMELLKGVEK